GRGDRDGRERQRRHGRGRAGEVEPRAGGQVRGVEGRLGGEAVAVADLAARRDGEARPRERKADVGLHAVDEGAVVEAAGRPQPRHLPPVAFAPAVVALPVGVDRERLAAGRDGAGDGAGDLVARDVLVGVDAADGVPPQVEGEAGGLGRREVAVGGGGGVDDGGGTGDGDEGGA